MKFSELPADTQEFLREQQASLHSKRINTAYEVLLYNEKGTRYFHATRQSIASNWAGFGGGSYWSVRFGAVQFRATQNVVGQREYELCRGQRYAGVNGKTIPGKVDTKKEVMAIAKAIGIFNI